MIKNISSARIIISLVAILAIVATLDPLMFILLLLLSFFCFLFVKLILAVTYKQSVSSDKGRRRQAALKEARIFLSPYKDIWRDLKLSNRYCSLYLKNDGVSISAAEKNFPYRKFNVVSSHVHEYTDLWDMFCKNFSQLKTYDGLLADCKLYKLSIYEYSDAKNIEQIKDDSKTLSQQSQEKLDINNCSEVELTELPGISIVVAKKIVKKRLELGGFKSIEEFFLFVNLKQHLKKQIEGRICVKKMIGARKIIKRNKEREVDL